MSKVDEWAPLVLSKLNEKLGEKTNDFINLLKDTGSILSGGFVLQAITKYDAVPDLDVYVPVDKMPEFLDNLVVQQMFSFDDYNHFDATIYCRSFLRKNGIKRVHTFRGHIESEKNGKLEHNDLMIDIMSVRKKKTVQEVCSNFDLTYCQVWFDGTDVFATHPDHITKKEGYLQGEYIEAFLKGNNFLKGRLRKYRERGFKTKYEPSTNNLPSIDFVASDIRCTKQRLDEILPLWFKKVATKWLTTTHIKTFYVPFGNHMNYMPGSDELVSSEGITFKRIGIAIDNENEFEVSYDEGYDSEDMDTNKLVALANREDDDEDDEKEEKKEEPELKYRRSMFELLHYLFTDTEDNFFYNFYHILYDEETKKNNPEKYQPYADYLRDNCTRKGEDMFGGDGNLYDIHTHPLEYGITSESLEGYLQKFLYSSDEDKQRGTTCYYKPDPLNPSSKCKYRLRLNEIQTIVSHDFFNKFVESHHPKLGLNTVMPIYEAALTNVKTEEKGYGDEFHETMCPFCLLPVSRSSGGIYMTHENPKKLRDSKAPYCKKELVVKSLLEKYRKMAPIIDASYARGLPIRLEFCVECGRACLKHQHIDITSAIPRLVPPKMKPDPSNPRQMIHDYATCAGGGRVELVARMLAVRDVYKYSLIKDPVKEREKAAFAADKAPNMKYYMDRATSIINKPPAERTFNTKVPNVKKYNNIGYEDIKEENAKAAYEEAIKDNANDDERKKALDEILKNKNEVIDNVSSNESNNNSYWRAHARQAGIELNEFGRPIQADNENENEGNEAVNDIVNRLMHGNVENWRGGRKKTYRKSKYIRKLKHKTYKLRKKK